MAKDALNKAEQGYETYENLKDEQKEALKTDREKEAERTEKDIERSERVMEIADNSVEDLKDKMEDKKEDYDDAKEEFDEFKKDREEELKDEYKKSDKEALNKILELELDAKKKELNLDKLEADYNKEKSMLEGAKNARDRINETERKQKAEDEKTLAQLENDLMDLELGGEESPIVQDRMKDIEKVRINAQKQKDYENFAKNKDLGPSDKERVFYEIADEFRGERVNDMDAATLQAMVNYSAFNNRNYFEYNLVPNINETGMKKINEDPATMNLIGSILKPDDPNREKFIKFLGAADVKPEVKPEVKTDVEPQQRTDLIPEGKSDSVSVSQTDVVDSRTDVPEPTGGERDRTELPETKLDRREAADTGSEKRVTSEYDETDVPGIRKEETNKTIDVNQSQPEKIVDEKTK